MKPERLPFVNEYVNQEVTLSSVSEATEGDAVKVSLYEHKSIFVSITNNTGTITMNIQASNDNVKWFNIRSITYESENAEDIFSTEMHFQYMRVTTTNHTSATIDAIITGRT